MEEYSMTDRRLFFVCFLLGIFFYNFRVWFRRLMIFIFMEKVYIFLNIRVSLGWGFFLELGLFFLFLFNIWELDISWRDRNKYII